MEIEEDERRGREETRLKGKLLLRASTSWPTEEAISRQIDSRLRLRHTDRNSAVILSHLSFPFSFSPFLHSRFVELHHLPLGC